VCCFARPVAGKRQANENAYGASGALTMDGDMQVDSAVSDYREFPPPAVLAGHLLCLWTQTIAGKDNEFAQRVLPDGCIDIVLINGEAPGVVGPWTEHFVARFAPGTIIAGARCHPGLAPALLGLPASELLNQSVPLNAMWGRARSARFERIADEPSLRARTSAMEAALLNRLASADAVDESMRASIQWLARHPHGRIEQLSQWLGFSRRQLQRRFIAAVGYGPKMFQSVLRFQRLLKLSGRTGTPRNLAEFSAEAGYADQAHMTREVQRFSGCAPTVLLSSARCTLGLSDLLNTVSERDR
jgi:AraC-like DNA-binding protein